MLVYGLDQGAKYLVTTNLTEGVPVPVIGDLLTFLFVKNSGAAFSLLSGYTWVFAIIPSLVVVFIVLFARRLHYVGWAAVFGLLLGGTLGNLNDRLFREPGFGIGHVIDFIHISFFPAIFNVADIAICVAMGLFVLFTLRGIALDGSKTTRAKKPAADDAE